MRTSEWIKRESDEDRRDAFYFSLKQENYELPMARITFGDEYILVPQTQAMNMLMGDIKGFPSTLKARLCYAWAFVAGNELSIEDSEIEKLFENGRTPDGTGSKTEESVFKWMENEIAKNGPYKFLGRLISFGYDWPLESTYEACRETPEYYGGEIGEEQEWEKYGDKDR